MNESKSTQKDILQKVKPLLLPHGLPSSLCFRALFFQFLFCHTEVEQTIRVEGCFAKVVSAVTEGCGRTASLHATNEKTTGFSLEEQ